MQKVDTNLRASAPPRERPILFSGDMVRAILDGHKTQTRRPVKLDIYDRVCRGVRRWHPEDPNCIQASPYQIGDVMWVRENFQIGAYESFEEPIGIPNRLEPHQFIAYQATDDGDIWRPSIHMPRWAARIFNRITGVSIERLQDITEPDARAEGFRDVGHFADTWRSLYGSLSWSENPLVWSYKFSRIENYQPENIRVNPRHPRSKNPEVRRG